MMTQSKTSHRETGDEIFVQWIAENCRQPPAFYAMVPPTSRADISISVKWKAPAVMILGNGAKKTGEPAIPENHALTLHNMTPETTTSSHYFFCSTRRFQPDNVQLTEMLREVITRAFEEEDKPMLERQQARMITPDLWSLKPVLLSIDTAAVKARRALDRLIEKEALARESVQTASARLPAT
jgi:vanillate O-demethylase monooxygenase subunit